MVALIMPELMPVKVPIVTGLSKPPVALDNCALNTFPAVYVPNAENETETLPASAVLFKQNQVLERLSVVVVATQQATT